MFFFEVIEFSREQTFPRGNILYKVTAKNCHPYHGYYFNHYLFPNAKKHACPCPGTDH